MLNLDNNKRVNSKDQHASQNIKAHKRNYEMTCENFTHFLVIPDLTV